MLNESEKMPVINNAGRIDIGPVGLKPRLEHAADSSTAAIQFWSHRKLEQIELMLRLRSHYGMMRALLILLLTAPLVAQQKPTTTQNPLDKLHDQAKELFSKAGFPFSAISERSW